MTAKKKSFEEKIIDEARRQLRKQLDDYKEFDENNNVREPKIGLPYNKKKMKRIIESFDAIAEEGKKRNIEVYLNSMYPNYVFYKYIFFQPMTFTNW